MGALTVGLGKQAYHLVRIVEGSRVEGEAWMQVCGPDKIRMLALRYGAGAESINGSCWPRMDGDNYWTVTCRTGSLRPDGTEAWFQNR